MSEDNYERETLQSAYLKLAERNAKLVAACEAAREYIADDDNPRSNRVLQQIYLAMEN